MTRATFRWERRCRPSSTDVGFASCALRVESSNFQDATRANEYVAWKKSD